MAKDGRGANMLGLPRPMLAASIKNIKELPEYFAIQPKLDGHRCLYSSADHIAYSRNGKRIDAIQEILEELEIFGSEDIVLDGELYCHGMALQTISSLVKRRQVLTEKIQYIVYDCVSDDPYSMRLNRLENLIGSRDLERVKLCPTEFVSSYAEKFSKHKEQGYEGSIIRIAESAYEPAKRSKSLIKVKFFNITSGKNGVAILHCKTSTERRFTVTAPGTMRQKQLTLKHAGSFVGRSVRVEYANLTKDGVPFHPVATMWRDKEDE